MKLKVVIPSAIVLDKANVTAIVAESENGFFGILPRRLDCIACLVPGIFFYEIEGEGEKILAIDEGILVKVGDTVRLSVRNALEVKGLETVDRDIAQQLMKLSDQEKRLRSLTEKLALGLLKK